MGLECLGEHFLPSSEVDPDFLGVELPEDGTIILPGRLETLAADLKRLAAAGGEGVPPKPPKQTP